MNNKSPLRYPGGKTRACKKLDSILNENFNIKQFNTVVSPFFGGGSFEFYLQNNYNFNIIANDKFIPLANFWHICQIKNKTLCEELNKYINKITKKEFIELRKKIMIEPDKFKQAVYYFIINRCSFSGSTLSGGFSLEASKKRFTKSSIDRVSKLNLLNFKIDNKDFETFLNKHDKDTNIIFLDPPYYLKKKSVLYGNNGDMHEHFDHEKLFTIISKKKNWIMTYNNCPYITNLYKNYKIIETSWSYCMNKSKKSSEIVIIG